MMGLAGKNHRAMRNTLKNTIGIMVFALLLLAGGADAAVLTVDDSGGANFTRIQDAIDNASVGDTILVYSGTYYENVNVSKQLIMRGTDNGGGKPVVDAGRSGSPITLRAGGSTLEGFDVRNSGFYTSVSSDDSYTAGIKVTSDNNVIKNNIASFSTDGILLFTSSNTLIGNVASNNRGGISLFPSGSNTGSNNMLIGNIASNNNEGITLLSSGSNNTLINNVMRDNRNNFGAGVPFDDNIDKSNLVNGKPIYYIKGATDAVYDSSTNAGTFYCISCVNVTIRDMSLNNNRYGIVFRNTTNSIIQNVNALNNSAGILLSSSSNNILIDNYVSNNGEGILLGGSSSNTLIGNNASNNGEGIFLSESGSNTLTNNMMTGNRYNFELIGRSDLHLDNNIDTSNFVDGKPIYYMKGATDAVYDSSTNAGTFYCISCVNVTIRDMSLNNNGLGLFFFNTTNSVILNVNVSNNGNGGGVSLWSSNNNMLIGSNVSNNYGSGGISLYESSGNTLIGNSVFDNLNNGISLSRSSNNTIYSNNLLNNARNSYDTDSNQWDNGNTGNRYSDFDEPGEGCTDADSNGICDSGYFIPGGSSVDRYPLSRPPPPPRALPGFIVGRVIDTAANPLAGVNVTAASGPDVFFFITGTSGDYVITIPSDKTNREYLVEATKAGFFGGAAQLLFVMSGNTTIAQDIVLLRTAIPQNKVDTASPPSVPADGNNTTLITATITNQDGLPLVSGVVNATTVAFVDFILQNSTLNVATLQNGSLIPTHGGTSINPLTVVNVPINASGQAKVTLRSGLTKGSVKVFNKVTVRNLAGQEVNATITVSFTAALPPEVAEYDTNGDGMIQRGEAVTAVVAFFNGNTSRATAVAVVVSFFGAPV